MPSIMSYHAVVAIDSNTRTLIEVSLPDFYAADSLKGILRGGRIFSALQLFTAARHNVTTRSRYNGSHIEVRLRVVEKGEPVLVLHSDENW